MERSQVNQKNVKPCPFRRMPFGYVNGCDGMVLRSTLLSVLSVGNSAYAEWQAYDGASLDGEYVQLLYWGSQKTVFLSGLAL